MSSSQDHDVKVEKYHDKMIKVTLVVQRSRYTIRVEGIEQITRIDVLSF